MQDILDFSQEPIGSPHHVAILHTLAKTIVVWLYIESADSLEHQITYSLGGRPILCTVDGLAPFSLHASVDIHLRLRATQSQHVTAPKLLV